MRRLDARHICPHIEGKNEAKVGERARADGPVEAMPVPAVLRQNRTPVTAFWSP